MNILLVLLLSTLDPMTFEIPVGDILASYEGSTRDLSFSDEIPKDTWEDVIIRDPLTLQLTLTHIREGVEVYFERFQASVEIDEIEYEIDISPFTRVFLQQRDKLNPDSLDIIDRKTGIIDIGHLIREEIIMAIHY